MDARGGIVAVRDEEKHIATFGLEGCTAVTVACDLPDGTRKGYIQHYSPLNQCLSVDTLAAVVGRGEMIEYTYARVVIMTPGDWTQDADGKYEMKSQDEFITNLLTPTAQVGLGANADVQVYPYSENDSDDWYDCGTLLIEFTASGATNILAEGMPIRPETLPR